MPQVVLLSSDRQTIPVQLEVAMMSTTIKTIIESMYLNSQVVDVIPVPNVRGYILRLAMKWAEHHHGEPPANEDIRERRTDNISHWDQMLLQIEQPDLFELIMAANFLDIRGLIDVACKAVANTIKGKSTEELRHLFNLQNDFSPAEADQAQRENEWLMARL